jgi:hypothetical protein
MSHRPELADEEEADHLLTIIDESVPSPAADAMFIRIASRSAPAATLEILWHLVPPTRRANADLSGRALLYP